MDDPRDVQIFRSNTTTRSSLSSCSAFAMETKRKKIRQSTFFQQNEVSNVQGKLDFELRMRDGAYKLLLASSKRDQVLNVSKSLLTSNARVRAYLAQLQKKKEEEEDLMGATRSLADPISDNRVPCAGKVAIAGLRIPLMWKDTDHFNNRGSSRRVAVFCVMQIGFEVFDTEMVVVDRSATDVCFKGVTIFNEAVPQFELKVELWSCAVEDDSTILANTPKKLAKKLRSSMGKASGKKFCPLLDSSDPGSFLHSHPIPPGTKYSLLAYTTLCLSEAEGSFQSHSLVVLQDADWSSWLPLYGNLCCRLVAQPHCMTQATMSGHLNQQQCVEGVLRCCSMYCVLSAGSLDCYFSPEEITAKVEPSQQIPVNKNTRIRVTEKDSSGRRSNSLTIINPSPGGSESALFTMEGREELEDWVDAFHQHFYDQSEWLHCCDRLMEMEVETPPKPALFLTKQADSVYNDLSINSPRKFESITDIIHSQIEKSDGHFLIGQEEEERGAPNWSTLFDGSRPVVVQKSVMSPSRSSTPFTSPAPGGGSTPAPGSGSTPNSSKKRRAPPPPSPCDPPPARPARPPLPASIRPIPARPPPSAPSREKENALQRPAPRSKTGRPSLDAKFSAIIQQLQRSHPAGGGGAAPLSRKNAPLGHLDVQPHGASHPQDPHARAPDRDDPRSGPLTADLRLGPVPAPRSKARKSFREKMNPKGW
ncbi:rhotekin-2 isoform X1 [Gadus morhua]|uniref:rhotekin-2 isoform X1 n=2 Tax=Gadus morhua TaxID=8049 RepID=UPI0011B7CEDB|nr:rhotekin-2 isoform X1 [Gadus morhua]